MTVETILDAFKQAARAADEHKITRINVSAIHSQDQLGIVACFVTCPDEFVKQLHAALDATLDVFMANVVGVAIGPPPE